MPIPALGAVFSSQVLSGLAGLAGLMIFLDPVKNAGTQAGLSVFPNTLPDPSVYLRLTWIRPQDITMPWARMLLRHGYDFERQLHMLTATERYPTLEELLRLYLVGVFDNNATVKWTDISGTPREWTLDDFLRANQIPVGLRDLILQVSTRRITVADAVTLHRRYGLYVPVPPETPIEQYPERPVTPDDRRKIEEERGPGMIPPEWAETPWDKILREAKQFAGLRDMPDEALYKLYQWYPHPQDLIRFAIREVFSPELARQLGLFEDMPPKFIEEARRVGLVPEHAAWYWAAHWQLPSYQMAREMLHRKIITPERFKMLLRALDYSPAWREELTRMAYRVKTRVDLRRLYRDGVIPQRKGPRWTGEDELVQAYEDYGYTTEDAIKMAEWTERRYTPASIKAAIELATDAYHKWYIDDDEFRSMLARVRLPEQSKQMLYRAARAKRAQAALDVQVRKARKHLQDGVIGEAEFRRLTSEYGLPVQAQQKIIDEYHAALAQQQRTLTIAEILRLYRRGIIEDDEEALSLLHSAGASEETANKLLAEAKLEKQTGSGIIPLGRMRQWFRRQYISEETFTRYLRAAGWPDWAIGAAIEEEEARRSP